MKRISGPQTPAALQMLQWILNPLAYMEKAAQQHPDIFYGRVNGSGSELIFVNHPQAIQYILSNDRKEFTAPGDLNQIFVPLTGNKAIFMLSGERHRRERQLLMPPFHGDRMRHYGQLITDLTQQTLDQIPVGETFTARSVTQSISLQVILQAVFGVHQSERYQKLRRMTSLMGENFNSPLSSTFLFFPALQRDWGAWSPWGIFLRQRQQLDDALYAEIAERRTQLNADRTDILSLLMAARDEAGEPMSDQELRDELVSLMIAGHETTATAMAWALYWIHHLPEVRSKLLQELNGLDQEHLDPMEITRLPYLTAVCQETLRIYPVGMLTFPRVVQQPMELLGYALEPDMIVMGCIYLIHHREDIYPNSKQFRPERFLERKFSNFEFMPFGGGARRCIGEALALFEMKLVLAHILLKYDLALAETRPVQPKRRGLTLAPAGGVKMRLTGHRMRQTADKSMVEL